MAEPVEKARRQATIEDRIEDEFQRAVGGIPAIERMREEYHHKYADMPSLHNVIDRIADDMRRRLLEAKTRWCNRCGLGMMLLRRRRECRRCPGARILMQAVGGRPAQARQNVQEARVEASLHPQPDTTVVT